MAKTKTVIRTPLLVVPHSDLVSPRSFIPQSDIFAGKTLGKVAGRWNALDAIPLSQAGWAWIAVQHPKLMQDFIQFPQDPNVLRELARVAHEAERQIVLQGSFPFYQPPSDGYVNLSDLSVEGISHFFNRTRRVGRSTLHVVFEPGSSNYSVGWHRMPNDPAAQAVWQMFYSAWRASAPFPAGLRSEITEAEIGDMVTKGARVLLVPDEAAVVFPRLTALKMGGDEIPEVWFPRRDARPRGSSASFERDGERVRLRVNELLGWLEDAAVAAWKRGKTPAVGLDLDGTLFEARGYTTRLFREWLAQYDGPDADEVREIVRKAGRVRGWNGEKILEGLGVTRKETLNSAYAYHSDNFFLGKRRASARPIVGSMKMVRILQRRLRDRGIPLKTVVITLRSTKDDSLPSGRSSSEIALRKNGVWDENSMLLRYEGEKEIDWRNKPKEPSKAEMAEAYVAANPHVQFISFWDNDGGKHEEYQASPVGRGAYLVKFKRDDPPDKPERVAGTYAVDALQASGEIDADGGLPPLDADNFPEPLRGPAFEPLRRDILQAQWEGQRPTAIFDLDDTLLVSSKPAKKILKNFLADWIRRHPGKEWTAEIAERFTPTHVEYGPRALLAKAGLDHLGIEEPFEAYFSRHFLNEGAVKEIVARPGALEVVLALQSLGVRIILLSGRLDADMREGTEDALRSLGFPVSDPDVELVMRQDEAESDEAFKARVAPRLVGMSDMLVGVFDKGAAALSRLRPHFLDVPFYLVGDRSASDEPDLPGDVVPIKNFEGEIGRTTPRRSPTIGCKLCEEGEALARELLKAFAEIRDAQMELASAGQRGPEARIERAARDAAAALRQIAELDPTHPKHAAFVKAINAAYAGFFEHLERRFEGILSVVNRATNSTFVAFRGPQGVVQVARGRLGGVDQNSILWLPETAIQPAPLSVTADAGNVDLGKLLPLIPQGPNLHLLSEAERYQQLVFGGLTPTYPRMDFALSWLVGSLAALSGKQPHELFVVEYGPGLSLAPMTALARAGVNVGWRDDSDWRRQQTEHALQRLPKQVRQKIQASPSSSKADPDAIIWNMPPRGKPFRELVKKRFTGVVAVQSSKDAETYAKELPEGTSWECTSEMVLDPNAYVFPSGFLSEGQVSPITFQIWQVR